MKKLFYVFIALFVIVMLPSCKGSAGKKAIKLVEEYGGKFFNKAKKMEIYKYGDDVLRQIEFVETTCPTCDGEGETWSGTCDDCGGDGVVYTIRHK